MSVLVKGMEMPKNCMSCPFPSVGVDWYYCYCPGVDGKAYDFAQAETVPDDCPLIALPDKHGRLVDADELKTAFPRCDNNMNVKIASVRATINHMDTIVEAEDEE